MIHAFCGLFTTAPNSASTGSVAPAPAHPLDPALLPILSAEALLQPHTKTLELIQRQVGVPQAHWAALYQQLFRNFASFVQQLPASEAHHHRQVGGLLAHSLDATLQALRIRRGVLLPTGASAEQLAEKSDVWTYATVTAALLHDLGKPVVDQTVTLFGIHGDELGPWHPLAGAMNSPAVSYKLSYLRGRRYRLHPKVPPLLVQLIVPGIGLRWIAGDLDAFEAWLATISGGDSEFAGKLGQIITQGDSLSVAADISGTTGASTVGSAPTHSFAERLAIALRQLIGGQTLPLNRAGAAGWVIEEDLWLVSKRALDALREQLTKDAAGASIPKNERLMDELQQHGIVMANGDRAIWKATIELAGWRQSFTLLRVPLGRLWLDPASRPAAIGGRVVIDGEAQTQVSVPAPESSPAPAEAHSAHFDSTSHSASIVPADRYADLPLPPLAEIAASDDLVASAVDAKSTTQGASKSADIDRPAAVDEPVTSAAPTTSKPPKRVPRGEAPSANGDFFDWIREGIAAGRLNINTPQARLHVTQQGLLLVSPGIFRDFAGIDGWAKVQKAVQQRELHQRRPDDTNIWTYRVVGKRKSNARLKGLLIPDAAKRLNLVLPPPNPYLRPLEIDNAGRAADRDAGAVEPAS